MKKIITVVLVSCVLTSCFTQRSQVAYNNRKSIEQITYLDEKPRKDRNAVRVINTVFVIALGYFVFIY